MSEVVTIQWEGNLITQLAALKRVPIAKVVRNAARDFARAAFDATPLAKEIPKPGVYALYDKPVRGPTKGQRRALARAKRRYRRINGKKSRYGAKARDKAAARVAKLMAQMAAPVSENATLVRYIPWSPSLSRYAKKVRWPRGWSKASWIGVMQALGMESSKGKAAQKKAEAKAKPLSSVVRRIGKAYEMTSEVEPAWEITDDIEFTALAGEGAKIIRAGLNNAATILKRTVETELKKQWRQ